MWIYFVYVALLALLTFLSIKLGDYVDLLDKKTKISGAFIGGVMLAAVTSLPELFTSSTAVFLDDAESIQLVMGNILGSNIFNMIVLALGIIIFYKSFASGKISPWHLVMLGVSLVFDGLVALNNFFPETMSLFNWSIDSIPFFNINIVSFIILIVYIIILIKQPKESDEDEVKVDNSKLTLKQVIILFIICSVLLIGTSIGITYVTDIVSVKLGLGKTVAGALFLGIATSIPELMSCLTLIHKKNLDAAWGDITGSCLFNFTILSIADILSVHETIYVPSNDVGLFLICTLVSWVCLFVITLIKVKKPELKAKGWIFLMIPLSLIIIGSYVCSIVFNII